MGHSGKQVDVYHAEGIEMKCYIGSKIIQAKPHESAGKPGYKVIYPDGYISWSPKDVFEEAYREVSDGEKILMKD